MTTLAIDGGTPTCPAPLPGWPVFDPAQIAAAQHVLASGKVNYWTGGECKAFEERYARELGRAYAISLANGTLALELALRAFGVGEGDEVVVPARTFIATASAVIAVGATPVVADIDPHSSNLTADTVAAVLTSRTRAVIPVHLGGWPVEMDPLMELARARGILVIEDCAQAHGATYAGRPVGSFGDAAAFSFCQDKIITTAGEGGLLVLDDAQVHRRAWEYKDHGKSLAKVSGAEPAPGRNFRWMHDSFGTNWRLSEIQAAVGLVALDLLPAWHAARTDNAMHLATRLAQIDGITAPLPAEGSTHAFYRLYTLVDAEALAEGWDRDRVLDALVAEGVPAQYGSCAEIYREKAFADAGLRPAERLPGASAADAASIAFLVHPTLSVSDIACIADAVAKVMSVATGSLSQSE